MLFHVSFQLEGGLQGLQPAGSFPWQHHSSACGSQEGQKSSRQQLSPAKPGVHAGDKGAGISEAKDGDSKATRGWKEGMQSQQEAAAPYLGK